MVSAAERSSFATCPWDTITPPTFFITKNTSLCNITMRYCHIVIFLSKNFVDLIGYDDRAVTPARTSDADGQISFAFAPAKRQQIQKQIDKTANCFFDLVIFIQIFYYLRIFARERTNAPVKIRVRQMPNIEHQVRVYRIAEFMAETGDLHTHRDRFIRDAESFDYRTPQRVNRQLARVDDHVGKPADIFQSLAFCVDRLEQAVA